MADTIIELQPRHESVLRALYVRDASSIAYLADATEFSNASVRAALWNLREWGLVRPLGPGRFLVTDAGEVYLFRKGFFQPPAEKSGIDA